MRRSLLAALVCLLCLGSGCSDAAPPIDTTPPALDFADMEPRVRTVLSALHERVRAEPQSAHAWAELGYALDAHAMLVEAESSLERAVALDPERFKPAYLFAFLGDLNGRDADELVRRFERAAELRGDYAPLFLREGDAMNRAGRYDRARASYGRALEIDPKYGKAHTGLGGLLNVLGEPEAAISHLEQARAQAPDDRPTLAALAQAYGLVGRMDDAQEASERMRATEGSALPHNDPLRAQVLALGVSSSAAFQRARRAMQAGDLAAAVPDLEIVAEAQPQDPDVPVRLAFVLLKLGRTARGVEELEKALKLDADHSEAHALMAQVEVERGALDAALERFARAYRGTPLDSDSHRAWGVALAQQSRHDEAAGQFKMAIEQSPKDPEPRYLMALSLELAGRVPEAIRAYEEAVRVLPAHPLAQRLGPLRAK
ncbi:MAG: tetratricopeptide repeat protein [bacterium]|nr:tetratricopeptide repeat protein [bacterium]